MTVIDFKRKYFFIKTIKTSSTSFEQWLVGEKVAKPESEEAAEFSSKHLYYSGRTLRKGPHQTILRPHATFREVRDFLGDSSSEFTSVSIVRHPFQKLVSLFWFEMRSRPSLKSLLSSQRTPVVRPFFKLWSKTKRFESLSDSTRLGILEGNEVSQIIKFENLSADLKNLTCDPKFSHLKNRAYPSLKTGFRSPSSDWTELFDTSLEKRFSKIFHDDFVLFVYDK